MNTPARGVSLCDSPRATKSGPGNVSYGAYMTGATPRGSKLMRQVILRRLPSRSTVASSTTARAYASSLCIGAPPHSCMSQLDCQPPRLDRSTVRFALSRARMMRRISAFGESASGIVASGHYVYGRRHAMLRSAHAQLR